MAKINETILFSFFEGTLSEEQNSEVETWIKASKDNEKQARDICLLFVATDSAKDGSQITDIELSRLHRRLRTRTFSKVMLRCRNISAILMLPLLVLSILLLSRQNTEKDSIIEVRSAPGMIMSMSLPDGTKVWLNSNSLLKYPARFGKKREVSIFGEAFFEVAKDKSHPFIVSALGTKVEATGTQFNVDAYNYFNRSIKVTLIEGGVNYLFDDVKGRTHSIALAPGQCAEFDRFHNEISITNVNTSGIQGWKEGKIILEDTPMLEALRMVGNRYCKSFILSDNSLSDISFTGMLSGQSFDTVLNYFEKASGLEFKELPLDVETAQSGPQKYLIRVPK